MMLMDTNRRRASPLPPKKTSSSSTINFQMKKSASVEIQNPPPKAAAATASAYGNYNFNDSNNDYIQVPKKSPNISNLMEFPTSPELILGKDIIHFSHPQHPISEVDQADLFSCAGCKEYGSGKRFTCQQCDFQLHEFCALAPPALKAHPFHMQHQLLFYTKPVKGGILKSKCDVCGKANKGYNFRCNACGYQMHPCCAMLSNQIRISIHPHPLRILPAAAAVAITAPTNININTTTTASTTTTTTTSPNDYNYYNYNYNGGDLSVTTAAAASSCAECKRKRSGRVYRCTVCDNYYLHAVCAKNMVNGLQANGIKGPEKSSILGTAARLASQVVVEFIGGLMEGLGEGVGEYFIQSVARGRRITRSSPAPPLTYDH